MNALTRQTATRPALIVVVLLILASIVSPIAQTHASQRPELETRDLSAQFMIRDQLASGDIDYPTSLLYRMFAYYGDERLPDRFRGAGSAGEDHALFAEIQHAWLDLPRPMQDQLIPFTVRPTDSRSRYFAAGKPNNTPDLNAPVRYAQGDCSDNWISSNSDRFDFKVWVHCDGDYEGDMAAAIEMIEEFWGRQVELMGAPIPDAGREQEGGDSRLDFYFIDGEGDYISRNGGDTITEGAAAHAAPSEPFIGWTSSGYMLGRRPSIPDPTARLVLAHEFFHLQSYAYNWEIAFGYRGSPSPFTDDFDVLTFAEFWFVEATADWAISYSYRDIADPESMWASVHSMYLYGFQGSGKSLYYSPRQWSQDFYHIYGAWVYFLFMEQRLGPEAIREYWERLRDVEPDDFARTIEILDELLPFEENFRDFSVQNLNLDLQPGDPISPSFTDIDQTFPPDSPPLWDNNKNRIDRVQDSPITYDVELPSLSNGFYAFRIEDDAEGVTFDFTQLAPSDATDVDLIVKVHDGDWERRQIDPESELAYCSDDPADDIDFVYVILTNHDFVESTTVRGDFTVSAVDTPCA